MNTPTPDEGGRLTVEQSRALADELKRLIFERTGITAKRLQCPRETSSMAPCIARDGGLACTDHGHCAGCDAYVAPLLKDEREKL